MTLLRLLAGATLAWCVSLAVVAPELPVVCALAAVVIAGLALWRPGPSLLLAVGLAPAGVLFAPEPARAAEMFAWAFLAGWLLSVWRPLSRSGWPRAVTVPVALYAAALAASWLALTLGGAAGTAPTALPQFVLQAVPQDHLIFSSPEAETWTLLQSLTGLGVLLAAVATTRDDGRLVGGLAWALVISAAVVAMATLGDILRQWAATGYGAWFLQRYVEGERESVAFTDLNAAGSLYALAGLTAAALAAFDPARRRMWVGLLAVMLPALWLAGSLSAVLATILVALASAAVAGARHWQPSRAQVAAAATVAGLAVIMAVSIAAQRGDGRATMGEALQMRSAFAVTSARMFASAPVFGVGIGRYFDRSAEFMPAGLREIYGNENAHNYALQEFAELGATGGVLFLWFVVSAVRRGWRNVQSFDVGDGARLGLFAGMSAYLLTCLAGHPLLVSGAAIPFWAALGSLAAADTGREVAGKRRRTIAAALAAGLLVAGIGLAAMAALRTDAAPADQGFHGVDVDDEGTPFRLMTRHAVTYIPGTPGFLRLQLRAPDDHVPIRPLVVTIAIAGRVVERVELDRGRWVMVELGVRDPVPAGFRRVDLRANQQWTEEVMLGIRPARRPVSAMVAEIVWTGANAVR